MRQREGSLEHALPFDAVRQVHDPRVREDADDHGLHDAGVLVPEAEIGQQRDDPRLRGRFLAVLPRLVIAEWTLGASALRYAARRPALRGGSQPLFE